MHGFYFKILFIYGGLYFLSLILESIFFQSFGLSELNTGLLILIMNFIFAYLAAFHGVKAIAKSPFADKIFSRSFGSPFWSGLSIIIAANIIAFLFMHAVDPNYSAGGLPLFSGVAGALGGMKAESSKPSKA